jgi:phosphatidylglycerophosphate synthase
MQAAKLEDHQENPIDFFFIRASDAAAPLFKRLGATPNIITTLSVIASVLAAWAVMQGGQKGWFVVWALLAYFFDCLDGHFARRYNMCSKFGDYYDHLTDWLYYGLLCYAAFCVRGLTRAAQPWWWLIYGAIAVGGMGMCWHFGCQESIYAVKRQASATADSTCHAAAPTLSNFVGTCPDPHQSVFWSRWMGCGTFTVLVIAIIVLFVR